MQVTCIIPEGFLLYQLNTSIKLKELVCTNKTLTNLYIFKAGLQIFRKVILININNKKDKTHTIAYNITNAYPSKYKAITLRTRKKRQSTF